jgi:transposase
MTYKYDTHTDTLIKTFCKIDDICKTYIWLNTKRIWNKPGPKPSMTLSEITSIVVFCEQIGYKDREKMYHHMISYHRKDFPNLPSYKTFVMLIHHYLSDIQAIIQMMMWIFKSWSEDLPKYVDSTPIKVCGPHRIINHKVCKWVAQRGKTSQGRFYGFKLHLVVDPIWKPLNAKITPGNIHDSAVLWELTNGLSWILVGDGWYVSKEREEKLREKGITLITGYRKTMKKLVTNWYIWHMRARQRVEMTFGSLKRCTNLVSSVARSVKWHIARIAVCLLTYCLRFLSYEDNSSPYQSLNLLIWITR